MLTYPPNPSNTPDTSAFTPSRNNSAIALPLKMPDTGEDLLLSLAALDSDLTVRRNCRSGYLELKPSSEWLAHHDFFKREVTPDGWVTVTEQLLAPLCDQLKAVTFGSKRPHEANVLRMITSVGTMTGHHADPFDEWISHLPAWDRQDRYGNCATILLKAANEAHSAEYLAAAVRIILNGAVELARQPGCEHDTAVALIGPEHTGKTSGLRQLMPDDWQAIWYGKPLRLDRQNKKIIEETRGYVIVECSELEGHDPRRRERIKNFLDDPFDIARPAYGRMTTRQQRSFVIIATANDNSNGVLDNVGLQSRFWPVNCRANVDLAALERATAWIGHHREQLWAQAVSEYEDNGPGSWRPPGSPEEKDREAVQHSRAPIAATKATPT